MTELDEFDLKILTLLQSSSDLSQRELAERVGLSQNACWRRLQRLTSEGLIKGTQTRVDLAAIGLDLTVFVMVRTRHHSKEWLETFRHHVERIPEVADFYRIGGDWDYLIKVVTRGMGGYDDFYQKLVDGQDLATVTGFFAMETIIDNRPVNLGKMRAVGASRGKSPRRA